MSTDGSTKEISSTDNVAMGTGQHRDQGPNQNQASRELTDVIGMCFLSTTVPSAMSMEIGLLTGIDTIQTVDVSPVRSRARGSAKVDNTPSTSVSLKRKRTTPDSSSGEKGNHAAGVSVARSPSNQAPSSKSRKPRVRETKPPTDEDYKSKSVSLPHKACNTLCNGCDFCKEHKARIQKKSPELGEPHHKTKAGEGKCFTCIKVDRPCSATLHYVWLGGKASWRCEPCIVGNGTSSRACHWKDEPNKIFLPKDVPGKRTCKANTIAGRVEREKEKKQKQAVDQVNNDTQTSDELEQRDTLADGIPDTLLPAQRPVLRPAVTGHANTQLSGKQNPMRQAEKLASKVYKELLAEADATIEEKSQLSEPMVKYFTSASIWTKRKGGYPKRFWPLVEEQLADYHGSIVNEVSLLADRITDDSQNEAARDESDQD